MRHSYLFLILLLSCISSKANHALYTLNDDFKTQVLLGDSLYAFIDHSKELTIEDLTQHFKDYSPKLLSNLESNNEKVTIWAKATIKNEGKFIKNEYFKLCKSYQHITLYTVENNIVQDIQISGSALKPSQKSTPFSSNQIQFSLDPEETKNYYFKLELDKNTANYHLKHIYIGPGKNKIATIIDIYTWQSLYSGIMILFALISFFMISIFREKIFIYLGMILVFFALYFMSLNSTLYTFFDIANPTSSSFITRIFVSLILIAGYLFTCEYVLLKQYYKKYFYYYTYFTIISSVATHIWWIFSNDAILISKTNNLLTAIWLVLTIIPVAMLAKRKDKSARILLLSFASMVISALLYTSILVVNISYSGWAKDSFQIGVILFSGILFYGLFDKINTIKQEKQHMKNLDELKSKFFSNISHEFRTPLSLIMDPIKQLNEKSDINSDKKLLQLAYKNSERLLQLINQLLELSKLEAGKMNLAASQQNFILVMKEILGSFESLAQQKNIHIQYHFTQENIPIYIDRDKIEKVFYNLISNAIKFSKDNIDGEITISLIEHENNIEVHVCDNGIGIPAHKLPYIFDRFFQVELKEHERNEGSGIGLALVKELLELHHGSIQVKSENQNGCCFIIHLPKGKMHLNNNEISNKPSSIKSNINWDTSIDESQNTIEINDEQFTSALEQKDAKPSILIVEDNSDVRNYIKNHLSKNYKIWEAENGSDGIDLTITHQPDLIISDVMMPKKNGYELSHFLKNDPRTSHIPIILLTAKAGQEEKITGLQTGADDYLVKPFDSKELDIRISNLIQIRKELQQHFSKHGPIAAQKTTGISNIDKTFLDKVVRCLEMNYHDNNYTIDTLASEVGMSKVHLNRKLKALSDFSTNKFIQAYRLQKALKMLQEKQGNVSEIAHKTGFNTTAYFVKCFREKYDVTPGSILEK